MERPNQKIKIEVQPQSSEEYSKDDDLNKTQEEIENLLNESQTIMYYKYKNYRPHVEKILKVKTGFIYF